MAPSCSNWHSVWCRPHQAGTAREQPAGGAKQAWHRLAQTGTPSGAGPIELEGKGAVHNLHPEGPAVAAREEAAASREIAARLQQQSSAGQKALAGLAAAASLQEERSGALQSLTGAGEAADLAAEYFSDEDPAYSSFSGESCWAMAEGEAEGEGEALSSGWEGSLREKRAGWRVLGHHCKCGAGGMLQAKASVPNDDDDDDDH